MHKRCILGVVYLFAYGSYNPEEVLVRWRILVLAAVVIVLAGGGVTWWAVANHKSDPTPKQRIELVASKLDVAPSDALESGRQLILPDSYGPADIKKFIKNYQTTFAQVWITTLQGRGLDVGWPGDLHYVAYDDAGNEPSAFTTTCPNDNQQSTVVSQDSEAIFYCATDKMSVPGMVSYPQGTLWAPLKVLLTPIHLAGPTFVRPGQQAAQALFVRLSAGWADALSRQIRAYAASTWKIDLPKLEQFYPAQEFAYCVAGAMGKAVFGPESVVSNAVYIFYGDEAAMPMSVNAAALKQGFAEGTLGGCVKNYWVQTDYPN